MPSPDPESVSWLRFALASVTVLGLMAGLAWALKYFTLRGWLRAGTRGGSRLKIVETLPLDARRRLVLIACDGNERLLLLGPAGDSVIPQDPAPSRLSSPPPSPN